MILRQIHQLLTTSSVPNAMTLQQIQIETRANDRMQMVIQAIEVEIGRLQTTRK